MATVNVKYAVEYLRHVGIDISDEVEADWLAQEKEDRRRRRAHKRELAKSCGHFRTHQTVITSAAGTEVVTYCSDCRKEVGCFAAKPNAPRPVRPA